jgi:hypothetical protein
LDRPKANPIMQTACQPNGPSSSRVFAVSAKRYPARPWPLYWIPFPSLEKSLSRSLWIIYDKIGPIRQIWSYIHAQQNFSRISLKM